MSILGALSKLFSALIRKVIGGIVHFVRKFWLIAVVVAVIYFCPVIGGWLATSGAPTWLSSAFIWTGTTITPFVQSSIGAVWTGVTAVGGAAWSAFSAASLGTQASLVLGATALIAPTETANLISETTTTAIDTVGSVIGDVASSVSDAATSLFSSPGGQFVLVCLLGFGVYKIFASGDSHG